MNLIKSPRELLFEYAGVPAMAAGGDLMKQFAGQIAKAIQQYKRIHGKDPDPADVQALREHVMGLGKKPEIKTDPITQARARHALATDPNISSSMAPELARDPFLTMATTGRTTRGTYLKPKVQDIADPNVQRNIEMKQQAGELEDVLPESITPSADYIGRMGRAMENQALAAGKDKPLIDKLKQAFFERYKRYPTDDELDVIVAEFNPTRHQYGEKGLAILGERPPTAKGLEDWRQRARTEGIEESYLIDSPRKYPKYMRDELDILKGQQPGTKLTPEKMANPDRIMRAGGGTAAMTADDMRAAMIARGYTPGKYVDRTKKMLAKGKEKAGSAARAAAESIPGKIAGKAAKAAVPALNVYQLYETGKDIKERMERGDYPGAAIGTIAAGGYGLGSLPGAGMLGTGVGLTADVVNMLRDMGVDVSDARATIAAANPLYTSESEFEPARYRSVMEDYK